MRECICSLFKKSSSLYQGSSRVKSLPCCFDRTSVGNSHILLPQIIIVYVYFLQLGKDIASQNFFSYTSASIFNHISCNLNTRHPRPTPVLVLITLNFLRSFFALWMRQIILLLKPARV